MHSKLSSADLLSHPGFLSRGTPRLGGTSRAEGVVSPGLQVEREEQPLNHAPASQKLSSYGPCLLAGMLSVEILLWHPKQTQRGREREEKKGRRRGG